MDGRLSRYKNEDYDDDVKRDKEVIKHNQKQAMILEVLEEVLKEPRYDCKNVAVKNGTRKRRKTRGRCTIFRDRKSTRLNSSHR